LGKLDKCQVHNPNNLEGWIKVLGNANLEKKPNGSVIFGSGKGESRNWLEQVRGK